jgi:hypothetical protein
MFARLLAGPHPGVSRAALQVARKLDLESGGYIPADWEGGETTQLEAHFGLRQLSEAEPAGALRRMILEADGTLVIFKANPGREGRLAIEICRQLGRLCLLLDIQRQSAFTASQELAAWEEIHQAQTLFVTGNTETESAGIQHQAAQLLEAAFFLVMTDMGLSRPLHGPQALSGEMDGDQPPTLNGVLDQLCEVLSLRDRIRIARLAPAELVSLKISLGQYIRKHYGLGESHGDRLLARCREQSGQAGMSAEDAVTYLIRRLWEKLARTHTLRRVK